MDANLIVAIIAAITVAVPVWAAAIVSIVRAWQGKDILPLPNLNAKVDNHGEQLVKQGDKIDQVATQTNGLTSQIVQLTADKSHAEGMAEQKNIDNQHSSS